MRQVIRYVTDYFLSIPLRVFITCTLFIAVAIFCNYYFGLNTHINALPDVLQFISWFLVFCIAFFFGYVVQVWQTKNRLFQNPIFLFLLVAAPAIFAWKMMADFNIIFSGNADQNSYWNHVVYWPLKLLVIVLVLYFIWKRFHL